MNRPVWKRWWFVGVAFGICAGLLAWLIPSRRGELQLADGRGVTLIATTYGNIHRLTDASPVAKVIARLFGEGRARRFGYRSYTAYYSTNSSIAVWTEWLTDGSNRPPRYASIRSESGFESEPVFLASESTSTDDKRRTVIAWRFENYPRRSERLELRFHDRPPPYRPNPLGRIAVPNMPDRSTPLLVGKAALTNVEVDGVTFTLRSLISGQDRPLWRGGTETGLAPWTTATFEVRESGAVSTNWVVRRIECIGATSNYFAVPYTRLPNRNGRLEAGFSSVMWPDEPDWNLTAEFVRTSGYSKADLWTLRGVPVSRTNSSIVTNFIATVHGGVTTQLSLKPAALQSAAENGYLRTTDLGLSFTSSVPEMRVELARVVDNRGRELKFGNGYALWPHTGPNGRYTAGLELPPDTQSIDVTFAFQRPRLVTFVVKPTFVRTDFDSAFPPASK